MNNKHDPTYVNTWVGSARNKKFDFLGNLWYNIYIKNKKGIIITMTHASRDTTTGLLFEQRTQGQASGIPLHQNELGNYYTKKTGKYYALTDIRSNKKKGIPEDEEERAKLFEGKFLLSKRLNPDEAYLDEENSILTIFEKKTQSGGGSVDEKLQTCAYKINQYRKVAQELNIQTVYYIYILDSWYKSPKYQDTLEYIKSVEGCDYFFWEE